jgi:hemerythrin
MEDAQMTYWRDSLLIGVDKIDLQHRKLVGIVDEVMAACIEERGRDVVEKALDFLLNYTKEHFEDEEALQAEVGYPGLEAHKRIHDQFIMTASALMNDFMEKGPRPTLVKTLNVTLVDWLVNHICTEDKKIGEFIKNKTY